MFVWQLQASVRALEQLFEELRQRTQQEMAVLPKASALSRCTTPTPWLCKQVQAIFVHFTALELVLLPLQHKLML